MSRRKYSYSGKSSANKAARAAVAVPIFIVVVVLASIANAISPSDLTSETSAVTTFAEIETTSSATASSETSAVTTEATAASAPVTLDSIPEYSGSPYVVVNDNVPFFSPDELTTTSFESYSPLDSLGRCGVAYASIGTDIMPTQERGDIDSVEPSGWHQATYDCVSGRYLYNRSHLIGFQLTGENANSQNLITGTRYFNVEGMEPFENMTADYITESNCHVLYRVTPIFDGSNLVASGVLMEAESVEDSGDSIMFCVYVYNVSPGVTIDYATGYSSLAIN